MGKGFSIKINNLLLFTESLSTTTLLKLKIWFSENSFMSSLDNGVHIGMSTMYLSFRSSYLESLYVFIVAKLYSLNKEYKIFVQKALCFIFSF